MPLAPHRARAERTAGRRRAAGAAARTASARIAKTRDRASRCPTPSARSSTGWSTTSGWTVTERERPGERVPVGAAPRLPAVPPLRQLLRRRRHARLRARARGARHPAPARRRQVVPRARGGRDACAPRCAAIEWPDDELSVFATLRGSLFAIGDEELLEYRQRHGRLHPFRIARRPARPSWRRSARRCALLAGAAPRPQPPAGRRHDRAAARGDARARRLRAAARRASRRSPTCCTSPSWRAATRPAAASRSAASSSGCATRPSARQAAEAPILEEGSDGVRLMTVHKAKGLEFPVVDPRRHHRRPAPAAPAAGSMPTRGLCALAHRRLGAGRAAASTRPRRRARRGRRRAPRLRRGDARARPARRAGGRRRALRRRLGGLSERRALSRRRPAAAPRRRRPAVRASAATACSSGPPSAPSAPRASRPGGTRFDGYDVVWWDPAALAPRRPAAVRHPPAGAARQGRRAGADRRPACSASTTGSGRATTRSPPARAPSLHRRAPPPRAPPSSPTPARGVELIELPRAAGTRRPGRASARSSTPCSPRCRSTPRAPTIDARRRRAGAHARRRRRRGRRRGRRRRGGARPSAAARAPRPRPRCRRETPLTLRADDGTLVEGVVDLAFRDGDGWMVVDFKTDQELAGRADVYRRQVALYARAIALATGQPARGVLLRV